MHFTVLITNSNDVSFASSTDTFMLKKIEHRNKDNVVLSEQKNQSSISVSSQGKDTKIITFELGCFRNISDYFFELYVDGSKLTTIQHTDLIN